MCLCMWSDLNPLLLDFCFPSNFQIYPKTDSYRLPTHRRGTHWKLFPWSLFTLRLNFLPNVVNVPRYAAKGFNQLYVYYLYFLKYQSSLISLRIK